MLCYRSTFKSHCLLSPECDFMPSKAAHIHMWQFRGDAGGRPGAAWLIPEALRVGPHLFWLPWSTKKIRQEKALWAFQARMHSQCQGGHGPEPSGLPTMAGEAGEPQTGRACSPPSLCFQPSLREGEAAPGLSPGNGGHGSQVCIMFIAKGPSKQAR